MTKTTEKTKRAVAAHNRKVERDNAAFAKLSASKKRVQIAKDVLMHLDAMKIKAKVGKWVTPHGAPSEVAPNSEIRDVFSKMKSCHACAVGSMFVSAMLRADKFRGCDLDSANSWARDDSEDVYVEFDDNDMTGYLKRFFSVDQIAKMESAFEQRDSMLDGDSVWDEYAKAVEFGLKHRSADKRLRAIMQNVIDNNGIFRP